MGSNGGDYWEGQNGNDGGREEGQIAKIKMNPTSTNFGIAKSKVGGDNSAGGGSKR